MARKLTAPADYSRQVRQLLDSAGELEAGATKVAIQEEAVCLADAHQDVRLGFDTRQELIDAATFGGAPEVAMVTFAWCLARSDEEP